MDSSVEYLEDLLGVLGTDPAGSSGSSSLYSGSTTLVCLGSGPSVDSGKGTLHASSDCVFDCTLFLGTTLSGGLGGAPVYWGVILLPGG